MRSARLVKVAMVLAVALVGAGALLLARPSKDGDFHGAPVPALFTDAELHAVDGPLRAAVARGHRVARAWLDAHPVASEREVTAWAVQAVGAPPHDPTELRRLRAIAARRTAAGVRAAVWLEQHGKKQPWKAIRNQTETFLPRAQEQATKQAMKAAFTFGGHVEDAAKARYRRPSPYTVDPSLNAGGVRVDVGNGHASYPSSHMVDAGIGMAFLQALDPHLSSEYAWMADEIAYSRLYTAGHYPSDVARGAFLGTLIGDYELRRSGLA